LINPSICGGGS